MNANKIAMAAAKSVCHIFNGEGHECNPASECWETNGCECSMKAYQAVKREIEQEKKNEK